MDKITIVSDGTVEGTEVFLPDGTEIGKHACAIQVNIGQDGPPHVVLTYMLGEMDVGDEAGDPGNAAEPLNPAIAAHRARVLSRG